MDRQKGGGKAEFLRVVIAGAMKRVAQNFLGLLVYKKEGISKQSLEIRVCIFAIHTQECTGHHRLCVIPGHW